MYRLLTLIPLALGLLLGGQGVPRALAMGEEVRLVNQLAAAASPYLRKAAGSPVAWQSWGEEAFQLAKKLDRPILLDIGAIWCHWCHVMAHETYGDPEIAKFINHHFVPIKVDRDERPDIDARYQQAIRSLFGLGGWPLTVFLTPEGKVFTGGTTFLPKDLPGHPGFRRFLPKVVEFYRKHPGEFVKSAEALHRSLAEMEATAVQPDELSPRLVEAIMGALHDAFDPVYGGFGLGEARFPPTGAIALALHRYAETGDRGVLELATTTLNGMARGGIRDQLGGGFHRYAEDRAWQLPHFEQLDYVQAQILQSYLQGYQGSGDPFYLEVAEGIIGYIERVLVDRQQAGFAAHQDSDMGPGDDGGYFTWTVDEVRQAVSADEAEVLLRYFDIRERGEKPSGRNVLWKAAAPEEIAATLGLTVKRVDVLIGSGKARLLAARGRRPMPVVDRTIYADRNGLLVSAYLEAYKVLGRDDLKAFALKTLDFLLTRLRQADGGLAHAFSDGTLRVRGLLDDQIAVTAACVDALEVTGEGRYLGAARELMTYAVKTYWDRKDGGFFDVPLSATDLGPVGQPTKPFVDEIRPASNSLAATTLLRLYKLTNDSEYRRVAEKTLKAFAGSAYRFWHLVATYGLAVDLYLNPPTQAVIVGRKADPRTVALWRAALGAFRPGKIVAAYDPDEVRPESLPPAVAAALGDARASGGPRAYVCAGIVCSLPSSDPKETASLVQTFGRQGSGGD